uniref:Uncharacterized protein n=1 Tax=Rhizophora mucronata TaxID=61149 RepID=A0A2P2INK3_RHIMU
MEKEISLMKPTNPALPNSFTKYAESSKSPSRSASFNRDKETSHHIDSEASRLGDHRSPKSSSDLPPHELSRSDSNTHFDLEAARRDFDLCTDPHEKAELGSKLQPCILKRLKELSEMGVKTTVGIEIADIVDFLKVLYSSNDLNVAEFGEISEKSREGVIRLQEGQKLVQNAQDLLRSVLKKGPFCID